MPWLSNERRNRYHSTLERSSFLSSFMFQKASDIGSNTDSGGRIKRAVSAFFNFCTCIVKGRILFSRGFSLVLAWHERQARDTLLQPRSQGLSSYRPWGSSLAPGGGKMRDPGNEIVIFELLKISEWSLKTNRLSSRRGKKLASKARAKRKTSGSPEACFQEKFNQ